MEAIAGAQPCRDSVVPAYPEQQGHSQRGHGNGPKGKPSDEAQHAASESRFAISAMTGNALKPDGS